MRMKVRIAVWAAGCLYSLVNVFTASLQHLFEEVLWETDAVYNLADYQDCSVGSQAKLMHNNSLF